MESVLPQEVSAEALRVRERALSSLGSLGPSDGTAQVAAFIEQFAAVGPLDHYGHVPAAAEATLEAVRKAGGAQAVTPFLQAALAGAIARSIDSGAVAALPPRVRGHQLRQFQRILRELVPEGPALNTDQDVFRKDMGLATLRLMAAAAQLIDMRCGVPRSLLTRQDWGTAAKGLLTFAQLGGFKPYIQIHTHKSYLDEFNEDGWAECYRCCAELCTAHPELRGMFGSSWFYDPVVMEISPRLSYLQSVPRQGGAHLWYFATGGDSIGNATATSPSRRKLYEEGRYVPKSYMMVWGREALIEWARLDAAAAPAAP